MKPLMMSTVYLLASAAFAREISLQSAPPVVVKTMPSAGDTNVEPSLAEIQVTFSKTMQDGTWSWSTWGEENFPKTTERPHYVNDGRTCVLPVKLAPGKFYAIWLNSEKFHNFKDADGRAAVPYLLTFSTSGQPLPGTVQSTPPPKETEPGSLLNSEQQHFKRWTERQFRSFFDARNFEGWPEKEKAELETKLIDTLKGPHTREYYQAINTLGAMRSLAAYEPLLAIAADRAEKDNRDRWMAIRALGILGKSESVPELIHLVYHGNINTRWWAQISLVQVTGTNFGNNWQAWGNWWNQQGGNPAFNPEFVKWYGDPNLSDPQKTESTLVERDKDFFEKLR